MTAFNRNDDIQTGCVRIDFPACSSVISIFLILIKIAL